MKKRPIDIFSPASRLDNVLYNMSYYTLTGLVPEHGHDCIEITFFTDGTGIHFSGNYSVPVGRGDVCITLQGGTHGIADTRNLRLYNISCTKKILDATGVDLSFLHKLREIFTAQPDAIVFHLNPVEFSDAFRIIRKMFDLYCSGHPDPGSMRSLFAILLCLFSQASSLQMKQDSVPGRLETVLKYIGARYRENIPISGLAAMASFSVSQFDRVFRKEYGCTPTEYIRELRMEEAARLLRETTLSISEIAFSLGFLDSNYFSHFFTRRNGKSPRCFRRHLRE